jgi:hypothetical protein
MKIGFDTPLTGTDDAGNIGNLSTSQIAALTFTAFVDTVNPPVKSYPIPPANVAAGTANANGSKHVTVDGQKDLGLTLVPGTTYYIALEDALGNKVSPETAVLTWTDAVTTPSAPANPSVA